MKKENRNIEVQDDEKNRILSVFNMTQKMNVLCSLKLHIIELHSKF